MAKPVSGTKEWAASNVNIQLGCSHGCRYCYAKASAIRFGRVDPEGWTEERLQDSLLAKNFGKRQGTIMFPTTHDITPGNLEYVVTTLRKMLEPGNRVLIVSKPHLDCITRLCQELEPYKDQILFRFTIGSMNNEILAAWEPGAPPFEERFDSLVYAHTHGFQTSVSMEPLLDIDEAAIVFTVGHLTPYVTDAIWIGKMNRAEERLRRNHEWNAATARNTAKLVASQSDERIKRLFILLSAHPKVKWKESIKAVVGLEVPTEAGLDI
jgi:DNA repair photolyase